MDLQENGTWGATPIHRTSPGLREDADTLVIDERLQPLRGEENGGGAAPHPIASLKLYAVFCCAS